MPYKCLSCGHKMKHAAQDGACPACFSMNLQRLKPAQVSVEEKPAKTKVEMALALLLWSLLAYGIYDHYLRSWLGWS